ncbi:hypothetical protein H8L32_19815 [Undibacterium sp. CY18W]|uniref:Uncharacterized protein n=1 Tax=Undibacterium hunanense TaxID=2762292 RepID=A0ABR6ZV08_9BURK|nr:hypothetical protein [Undibacterium hunanense]MBC3919729.1 hypothetical protein [Undibacterium hunanense]
MPRIKFISSKKSGFVFKSLVYSRHDYYVGKRFFRRSMRAKRVNIMVTSVTSASSAQNQQLIQQAADARAKQNSETIGAAADRDSGTADAIADQKRVTDAQAEQQAQAVNKQNSAKQAESKPPEQPKPVVNTSGQVTGTTINTTA